MAERPSELGDFNGVRHFEAKFWVEGVTFRAKIYRLLDGGMVVLQLCRWKFSHKTL